jgi:hypothetical protein
LPPLGKYLVGAALALQAKYTGHAPDLDPKTITTQEANDYMAERAAEVFPGLAR